MGAFFSLGESFVTIEYNIDEILKFKVLPGNVLYKTKSGHFIKLFNAGDTLRSNDIEKYQGKGVTTLHLEQAIDEKEFEFLETHFKIIQESLLEPERLNSFKELMRWFQSSFWESEKELSLLAIVSACSKEFLKVAEEDLHEFHDKNLLIYNRAFVVAALSVFLGIQCGYRDYQVLSDLFNVSFLLDMGLCTEDFNYQVRLACEKERIAEGTGLAWLQETSSNKYQFFKEHPRHSYEFANEKLNEVLFNTGNTKIILRHHENDLGKGFPEGIEKAGMTEVESVVALADKLVSFENHDLLKTKNTGFLKKELEDLKTKKEFIYLKNIINVLSVSLERNQDLAA